MPLPATWRNRRSFVDSSAYLALLDADDEHHDQAAAIMHDLVGARFRQITTNVLVIESHALILSVLGSGPARRFLAAMEEGATTIVRVRATDEARARAIIYRHVDKDYSFADAISFAVMERLGLTLAFTFDRHFAQYGLMVCRPGLIAR